MWWLAKKRTFIDKNYCKKVNYCVTNNIFVTTNKNILDKKNVLSQLHSFPAKITFVSNSIYFKWQTLAIKEFVTLFIY